MAPFRQKLAAKNCLREHKRNEKNKGREKHKKKKKVKRTGKDETSLEKMSHKRRLIRNL